MKTFSEAVKAISVVTKPGDEERLTALMKTFESEAGEDPVMIQVLTRRLDKLVSDVNAPDCTSEYQIRFRLASHLFSAFMHGLTVGREMEKQDFPAMVTQ